MSGGGTKRGLLVAVVVGLGLAAIGCGGTRPHAIEVTEPWTTGDERALGIEEPAQSPTPESPASQSPASESPASESPASAVPAGGD